MGERKAPPCRESATVFDDMPKERKKPLLAIGVKQRLKWRNAITENSCKFKKKKSIYYGLKSLVAFTLENFSNLFGRSISEQTRLLCMMQ
jgi:hypothetical protein